MNLVVPPYSKPILTQKALKEAIKANKEFHTADIIHGYGKATTPAELKAAGIDKAQFRYGARLEKVWYGRL